MYYKVIRARVGFWVGHTCGSTFHLQISRHAADGPGVGVWVSMHREMECVRNGCEDAHFMFSLFLLTLEGGF